MSLSKDPLYSQDQIAQRVTELAHELDTAFDGNPITAIITLKGAIPFATDLVRAMKTPVKLDLIRAKSYTDTKSSGEVKFSLLPETDLFGKTVLIIEDIVDTGNTARAIYGQLVLKNPRRIHLVTLLDKPSRREVDFEPDWVGFTIDDLFVVGYGLDYNADYRQLPDIRILEL
jgi:hypoxanthine phosphoribosyltransferase